MRRTPTSLLTDPPLQRRPLSILQHSAPPPLNWVYLWQTLSSRTGWHTFYGRVELLNQPLTGGPRPAAGPADTTQWAAGGLARGETRVGGEGGRGGEGRHTARQGAMCPPRPPVRDGTELCRGRDRHPMFGGKTKPPFHLSTL